MYIDDVTDLEVLSHVVDGLGVPDESWHSQIQTAEHSEGLEVPIIINQDLPQSQNPQEWIQ